MLGLIALDIDGTLTDQPKYIPPAVLDYLSELIERKWGVCFVTGRPFCWAKAKLARLRSKHWLAVANGTSLLCMPSEKIVINNPLTQNLFEALDEIASAYRCDYVIYGGVEHEDFCYWRPNNHSEQMRHFLTNRYKALEETWSSVNSWSECNLKSYSSAKFFGSEALCNQIAEEVTEKLSLSAPVIKDPYSKNSYVLQLTHKQSSKAKALSALMQLLPKGLPLIAAGDDYNDEGMLRLADLRIVMETAPEPLKELADIVAPPASFHGIIPALNWAVEQKK